jgi:hypothetical protein
MIKDNRQLVADGPVEFENKQLKFNTSKELPTILDGFMEYTSY